MCDQNETGRETLPDPYVHNPERSFSLCSGDRRSLSFMLDCIRRDTRQALRSQVYRHRLSSVQRCRCLPYATWRSFGSDRGCRPSFSVSWIEGWRVSMSRLSNARSVDLSLVHTNGIPTVTLPCWPFYLSQTRSYIPYGANSSLQGAILVLGSFFIVSSAPHLSCRARKIKTFANRRLQDGSVHFGYSIPWWQISQPVEALNPFLG